MQYSNRFKQRMISELTGPGAISAYALSKKSGVSQTALSRWLREAGNIRTMTKSNKKLQSPRDWPLEKKLRVVYESMALSDKELGEFLRREGLHEAQLEEMRSALEDALSNTKKKSTAKRRSSETKKIKCLEKELARKDKALAEVTAILVMKKKLDSYFAEVEEKDTKKRRDS